MDPRAPGVARIAASTAPSSHEHTHALVAETHPSRRLSSAFVPVSAHSSSSTLTLPPAESSNESVPTQSPRESSRERGVMAHAQAAPSRRASAAAAFEREDRAATSTAHGPASAFLTPGTNFELFGRTGAFRRRSPHTRIEDAFDDTVTVTALPAGPTALDQAVQKVLILPGDTAHANSAVAGKRRRPSPCAQPSTAATNSSPTTGSVRTPGSIRSAVDTPSSPPSVAASGSARTAPGGARPPRVITCVHATEHAGAAAVSHATEHAAALHSIMKHAGRTPLASTLASRTPLLSAQEAASRSIARSVARVQGASQAPTPPPPPAPPPAPPPTPPLAPRDLRGVAVHPHVYTHAHAHTDTHGSSGLYPVMHAAAGIASPRLVPQLQPPWTMPATDPYGGYMWQSAGAALAHGHAHGGIVPSGTPAAGIVPHSVLVAGMQLGGIAHSGMPAAAPGMPQAGMMPYAFAAFPFPTPRYMGASDGVPAPYLISPYASAWNFAAPAAAAVQSYEMIASHTGDTSMLGVPPYSFAHLH